jgi:indolepyruvate ferredoxin oxidoreductase beta subunit
MKTLSRDPLNIIIIGVAGQGNVMTSLLVCNALVREGYVVTFGQTYLPQQRGGPVINYIRVSTESVHSPIIPAGDADIIVGMEPVEAMRMLAEYGNPDVVTIVNPRMIGSIDIAGSKEGYPDPERLLGDIREMSARTWTVDATGEAQKLGNPIIANVILVGVLVGINILPLDSNAIERELKERFPKAKAFETNMKAFYKGMELAKS